MSKMIHFKELSIQNFKGIKKLKIKGISDINIFLGKSNAGKTTVLESIFTITGMFNPNYLLTLNNFRLSTLPEIESEFFYVFNELGKDIKFDFLAEEEKPKSLLIKPKIENKKINELNYIYDSKKLIYKKVPIKNQNNLTVENFTITQNDIGKKYNVGSLFLFDKGDINTLNVKRIIIEGKRDTLLKYIHLVDKSIKNIEMVDGVVYLTIEDQKVLQPIGSFGSGIRKFITLIAGLIYNSNNIVLIDELENSLFFLDYSLAWKIIFELSNEFNNQVFITTHSKELLESLSNYLNDSMDENYNLKSKQKLSLYSLKKENNEHKIFLHEQEYIQDMINNIEIRT